MEKDTIKKILQNRIVKIGFVIIILSVFLFGIGYINIDFCWPITAVVIGILSGCYLIIRLRKPSTTPQYLLRILLTFIVGSVLTGIFFIMAVWTGFDHHWLFYPFLTLLIIIPIAALVYLVYLLIFFIKSLVSPRKPHASNNYD